MIYYECAEMKPVTPFQIFVLESFQMSGLLVPFLKKVSVKVLSYFQTNLCQNLKPINPPELN